MTNAELDAIEKRMAEASPGPWTHDSYPSGTEYVHMRHASGKSGPRIMGPDGTDQDGHVGAHMSLYNVPAFVALTGEQEEKLVLEKWGNAEFIAHSRQDVPALVAEVRRLKAQLRTAQEIVNKHATDGIEGLHCVDCVAEDDEMCDCPMLVPFWEAMKGFEADDSQERSASDGR